MRKDLLRKLHQKPIAYYPIYRQMTGSTTAGILLSQIMYWFSIQDKFYKTDKEIKAETLLTDRELKTAKSKIKELDFIKVTREGVPAKTYYKIDWNLYEIVMNKACEQVWTNQPNQLGRISQTEWDESAKLNGTNQPNSYYNTKNTTETTTKKKSATSSTTSQNSLFSDFQTLWNKKAKELNLSQIKSLTKSRVQKLKTRLKENPNFLEDFKQALGLIAYSNFLLGVNNRSWKVNFDWLITNDTNIVKVLENKYSDNRGDLSNDNVSISKYTKKENSFKNKQRIDEYSDITRQNIQVGLSWLEKRKIKENANVR